MTRKEIASKLTLKTDQKMRFFYLGVLLTTFSQAFGLLADADDSPHLKDEPVVEFASDQLQAIENFIIQTERSLETHKQLRDLIVEIREEETLFLQDPSSQEHAKNLVFSARKALAIIADKRLDHLFSSHFLKDLHFYASIAGKNIPSRPS